MSEEKKSYVPPTLSTVLGCELLQVELRDGTKPNVQVYSLPINDVPYWLSLDARGIDGEAEMVERLYLRKEEGFVASLTPASYEAVLAKGEELNRPFCDRARSRAAERETLWVKLGRERLKLATELGLNLSAMPSQESAPPTA